MADVICLVDSDDELLRYEPDTDTLTTIGTQRSAIFYALDGVPVRDIRDSKVVNRSQCSLQPVPYRILELLHLCFCAKHASEGCRPSNEGALVTI